MNKLTIIGNLTRDPETRTTRTDKTVCSFTVAVNRRARAGEDPETDYFRVQAWNKLGDNCQRYLAKGRKVCVVGPVTVNSYEAKDGSGTRFSLEVTAEDVEFLTSRSEADAQPASTPRPAAAKKATPAGFTEVDDDDLPF